MADYVHVQDFIRISLSAPQTKTLSCNFCVIVVSFLCPNSNISRVKVDGKHLIRAIVDPVQVKYSFSQDQPN